MMAYEQTSPDVQFVLTPRTLDEMGDFREASPVAYEKARAILYEAQTKLFVPFLTQTPQPRLRFEFERLAYAYIPYRIGVISVLLGTLGLRQFEALYVSAFMRATKTFISAAPTWDLEAEAIEVAIRRYLSSSLRLASIDRLESMVQTQDFSKILIAVTKADFGLTAIFLVMDESIHAAKWTVRETFDRTRAAVTEYDQLVSELWSKTGKRDSISGSLAIEGDLMEGLRKLSADIMSQFEEKPKPE